MIYLFDFEDSFTYNILSHLQIKFPDEKIKLIEKNQTLAELKLILNKNERALLIFGPGPGHPDQYDYIQPLLTRVLEADFLRVFGICLGHQLIAKNLGFTVGHCTEPVHGIALNYKIPKLIQVDLGLKPSIQVQCYNSLAVKENKNISVVKKLCSKGEVVLMYNDKIISYQFHPESIGTYFPSNFFQPLDSFLL